MSRHLATHQGSGLIETLVTMLIVAAAVIGLVRFQNNLAYADSFAQQQADATILALNRLESLRDYAILNTNGSTPAYQSIVSGSSTSTGTNATYTLTWTVTSNTNPTYKNIDIIVSWNDRNGTARSVRLITRVAGIEPATSAIVMT